MKIRWQMILLLLVVLLIAGCTQDTTISFKNEAECGVATLTLRNENTGNERTYTIEQDKTVDIDIDNGVAYHYDIEYERLPNALQCDAKSGTLMLPNKGDTASFALESVTPTPGAETPTPDGQ